MSENAGSPSGTSEGFGTLDWQAGVTASPAGFSDLLNKPDHMLLTVFFMRGIERTQLKLGTL